MKKALTAGERTARSKKRVAEAKARAHHRAVLIAEHKPVPKAKAWAKSKRKRKWSPDSDVACCSARAVATAVGLATGVGVRDADVLALHEAAGGHPERGASILGVLGAARGLGLPVVVGDGLACACRLGLIPASECGPGLLSLALLPFAPKVAARAARQLVIGPVALQPGHAAPVSVVAAAHALILGLDLPNGEPHAVTVAPDGTWWSWGEPFAAEDFPDCVIEEAWAVSWA